ncbi:MAG: hypothetical protein IPG79_10055 [Saprospiraceae bacterium]|nr:hypothetical protein [Saprospiraceae bacterium]
MNFSPYNQRPVRFLEIFESDDWKIKIYSVSVKSEWVDTTFVHSAKENISEWLKGKDVYPELETYNIATLILHEGKEGCFAILSWWIDQNMLQLFVYLSDYDNKGKWKLYSGNGIVTCIWEMAVLWYERNAWVKHVVKNHLNPDFESYLADQYNDMV